MRAYRPYALHTMVCVVGIQTTMDTIAIRLHTMRPYAVGIGLGVWGCTDLETMIGSRRPSDHEIWGSGDARDVSEGPVQIGMQIGIRH